VEGFTSRDTASLRIRGRAGALPVHTAKISVHSHAATDARRLLRFVSAQRQKRASQSTAINICAQLSLDDPFFDATFASSRSRQDAFAMFVSRPSEARAGTQGWINRGAHEHFAFLRWVPGQARDTRRAEGQLRPSKISH